MTKNTTVINQTKNSAFSKNLVHPKSHNSNQTLSRYQPDRLDAMLEDLQVGIILAPVRHDLVVYEGGHHLRLQEAGEERSVALRLVREEGRFVEVHHRLARS